MGLTIPKEIVQSFLPGSTVTQANDLGSGLIHQTLLLESENGSYVFQRLNTEVFKDVEQIMANIAVVQETLASANSPTLVFLPNTKVGGYLAKEDGSPAVWRCSEFVANTTTYDTPPGPTHLINAARAFATFGMQLKTIESERLHPTIPRFHDTPHRFETLHQAWKQAPEERRCQETYQLIKECSKSFLEFGLSGLLPPAVQAGVSHNDTKLNNCLFKSNSDQVVCVIDLDTVMSGSWLMDLGDLLRTTICEQPEDSSELDKIKVNFENFGAIVQGYADIVSGRVPDAEIKRVVYSAFLMTFELSLRFFTDHLENDRYFGADYMGHNLVRAKSQLRLACEISDSRERLESIVKECFQA